MPPFINTLFLSLIGGILPSLIWLWFWLKEDRLHPEPKLRIMLGFLLGMTSVFIVLPIEKAIYHIPWGGISILTVLLWASTEEIFKYLAGYFGALRGKDLDEPIDAIIYMITAALGFSALENALFLSNLIDVGLFSESIITGNSRFIGATLLHVASSASIGVMMGLSFYKKPVFKKIFLFTGLSASIVLHTLFNLLIIKLESNIFLVFSGVWIVLLMIIVLIEKVKSIRAPRT